MGEKELIIFIILINGIFFIFIIGTILFIYHYRKRKILYNNELLSVKSEHTKAILNAKLESREQTMINIGNDIHDSVGQKLTLASLYLQRISMGNNDNTKNDKLSEINTIINEALIELRLISNSLVNPAVSQLDLPELIEMEIKRVTDLNPVKINFKLSGKKFELSGHVKNNIHKIIQEFLQNSIKHSNCQKIDIHLELFAPNYALSIKDDGIGFDINNVIKGIGLTNINRRINSLNAILEYKSEINQGTKLNITGKC